MDREDEETKEKLKEVVEEMSDDDQIMLFFMGCCGLGEGIFGDRRL